MKITLNNVKFNLPIEELLEQGDKGLFQYLNIELISALKKLISSKNIQKTQLILDIESLLILIDVEIAKIEQKIMSRFAFQWQMIEEVEQAFDEFKNIYLNILYDLINLRTQLNIIMDNIDKCQSNNK